MLLLQRTVLQCWRQMSVCHTEFYLGDYIDKTIRHQASVCRNFDGTIWLMTPVYHVTSAGGRLWLAFVISLESLWRQDKLATAAWWMLWLLVWRWLALALTASWRSSAPWSIGTNALTFISPAAAASNRKSINPNEIHQTPFIPNIMNICRWFSPMVLTYCQTFTMYWIYS